MELENAENMKACAKKDPDPFFFLISELGYLSEYAKEYIIAINQLKFWPYTS